MLPDTLPDIVWLAEPGPGGGGGGGGNKSPEPPKKVELPGKQEVSVPKPPEAGRRCRSPSPNRRRRSTFPAVQTAAAPVIAPGAITNNQASTESQGAGVGGGGGDGRGTGVGPGDRLRSGARARGGGTGGGVFRPGNGVRFLACCAR